MNKNIRPYREKMCKLGQSSPSWLHEFVCKAIDDISSQTKITSIADIGCGTGRHSTMIKKKYPAIEENIMLNDNLILVSCIKSTKKDKKLKEIVLDCSI